MSLIIDSCFEKIIGLSQTECDCFPDIPASVSESGIYLDQLEGLTLNMVNAASDCASGSIWDMMDSARSNAIQRFKTDLTSALNVYYQQKNNPFNGLIGRTNFRKDITLTHTYAGQSICTNNIRGGIMKIKRIGAAFTQTGTFDIDIYNTNEYGSIETVTLSTQANKLVFTDVDIELPMTNDSGQYMRYDFVYTVADAPGNPKDMISGCGCAGKNNYYNESIPRFRSVNNTSERWMNFVMMSSFSGNDISDIEARDSAVRGIKYLNGIVLDVEFSCDITDLLCQNITGFQNNPVALNVATSIQYLSGVFLIDSILASGNINIYTMTDRERLMGKKNSYAKEYNRRLTEEIVPTFNIEANDCLICNKSNQPRKRGILA